LAEVRELLSLRLDHNRSSAEVRAIANAKISNIEEKLRTLQAMKKALSGIVAHCPGCGPASDCPILESIDSEEVLR
jgi:MerR family copper efflux transcriptional regulator